MENKDIILNNIFTNKFDEHTFNNFIINLLNLDREDRLSGTIIKEEGSVYKNHIEYVKDIGRYIDTNRKNILTSIVKLKDSPDKARTLQRNFIAKHMEDVGAEAAIVALYSDNSDIWRISYVKLDYSFGISGLEINLTPAKRYSYLIDPKLKNHTVQEQLKKLLFDDTKKPSVEEIENVFSVEVVTKEFYQMYKDKYLDLKDFLENNNVFIEESKRLFIDVKEFSEEFSKKLMGQISFLYFLQKKGWLGVKIVPKIIDRNELRELYKRQNEETREIITTVYKSKSENMVIDYEQLKKLPDDKADMLASVFKNNSKYDHEWGLGTKTFIRDIFDSCKSSNKNFFNDYLEPLFYNALNKKRGSNEYYQRFNCKIPFLNGGLFEPIYKYEWEKVNIKIPNEFFSNDNNEGLLDLFDMYNFTINEDEPLEKEVAVDPEMLGKIFENLLDVKERKSKGAFYTPREIVHYMCQECLINYLNNETNIDTTSLELLIKYGEVIKDADMNIENQKDYKMPKFIIENLDVIDKALENVTVADPAVGSGAFPLGMLNEIVKARSIIVEYMTKNLDDWEKEDFIRDNKKSLYDLKKNAMKKSIFAVDIEPSAVDITKLRLWLSLVVDADVKTINTLPNLDYNVMVGNSLIDEFNGIKLFDDDLLRERDRRKKKIISNQISMNIDGKSANIGIEQEAQLLEEIQILQNALFDEKDTSEKIRIKKEIEYKEWELIEYKLNREKGLSFREIQEFKKQKKSKKKPYFLWKLEFSKIFKQKKGFDIVIGNPPYVGEKGNKDKFREISNTEFGKKFYRGKMDLFYFFFHKGIDIGKEKSILSFITTNYFITADSAYNLRKDIYNRTDILKIVNFNEMKIFESARGQHNIITILQNRSRDTEVKNTEVINTHFIGNADADKIRSVLDNKDKDTEYTTYKRESIYDGEKLYIRINNSDNVMSDSILNKIMKNSFLISSKCQVKTGVNTGCDFVTKSNYKQALGEYNSEFNIEYGDGIFVVNDEELKLMRLNDKELGIVHKFYKNSDVGRYVSPVKWDGKYLIYITKDMDINDYPNIKNHLQKYRSFCQIKREYKTGQLPWYSLHWAREEIIFKDQDKIVLPYRSKENIFGYSEEEFFASKDVLFIRTNEKDVNLKYILGFLNSKLCYFWLKSKGKVKGNTLELYVTPISEIPIRVFSRSKQEMVINKIENVLSNKKQFTSDENINIVRDEIDKILYKLYELTDEEIEFIEIYYRDNIECR